MPAEKPPKLPPVRVARAVDAVRRRMRRVEQRMVPAPAAVLDLVTGAWVSRAIYTAAKFGIADVLGSQRACRAHAARAASFHSQRWRRQAVFEWLDDEPGIRRSLFNEGTTSASETEIEPVLAAYDFSGFGTIVDVGGGHGRLLAAILRKTPQARGILFDAESVVAGAPAVLDAAGVADRTAVVGGSFFESVPSGGDAYVLKHIVHDWDESKVLEILRNVRTAMAANTKLLVIETVIPDDDREHLSKLLDLEMLVAGTGKERTAAEYAQLLSRAGFRNTRVIPTFGPASIVESEAA